MTMSDDELIELECMESVMRTGTFPDGCDASRYMGMNYVQSEGTLVLTDQGLKRLLELRALS
jgi:hypothetical protein